MRVGKTFDQLAILGAHCVDLIWRQFAAAIQFARASAITASTLGVHITDVVAITPEPKMVGTNAGRIVAPVTDRHLWWDWPKVESVREAMSRYSDGDALTSIVKPMRQELSPIALRETVACPVPAVPGLVDVPPEPCNLLRGILNMHAESPFRVPRLRLFAPARGLQYASIIPDKHTFKRRAGREDGAGVSDGR